MEENTVRHVILSRNISGHALCFLLMTSEANYSAKEDCSAVGTAEKADVPLEVCDQLNNRPWTEIHGILCLIILTFIGLFWRYFRRPNSAIFNNIFVLNALLFCEFLKKSLSIYIPVPSLTGKPKEQRFTVQSCVLTSISSWQRSATSGCQLPEWKDFGARSLQLNRPTYAVPQPAALLPSPHMCSPSTTLYF